MFEAGDIIYPKEDPEDYYLILEVYQAKTPFLRDEQFVWYYRFLRLTDGKVWAIPQHSVDSTSARVI